MIAPISNRNLNALQGDQIRRGEGTRRIDSVVLLAGAVGSGNLESSAGRSRLDLPVAAGQTVWQQWEQALEQVAEAGLWSMTPAKGRIMINDEARPIQSNRQTKDAILEVERDPHEFRGTGGVLRDLAEQFDDDCTLLVGNGPQVLLEPLANVVREMLRQSADVVLTTDRTHTPVGLMLVRCAALRSIPDIGFVDFKEQALPSIAQDFRVTTVQYPSPIALPIRTRENYIHALRALHRIRSGGGRVNPFQERWRQTFSIVEEGVEVDASACIHDSVVLAGARVEPGAVVVRSVIGPGATVGRNETALDKFVSPESVATENNREVRA